GRPASSRSSVVFPEPLSPTRTVTAWSPTVISASSLKPPSRLVTRRSSTGAIPEPARRGGTQPQQETEGHDEQEDGEHHRGVEIRLQCDVDGERHGLRGPGEIPGERDRGAKLAQGARAAHGEACQQRWNRQRQHDAEEREAL